jgi:hypothetical protein
MEVDAPVALSAQSEEVPEAFNAAADHYELGALALPVSSCVTVPIRSLDASFVAKIVSSFTVDLLQVCVLF